jgi:hypothetical protein
MKRRIAWWAFSGLAVACCLALYGLAAAPDINLGRSLVVAIIAPASLLGRRMPVAWYWAILLNGAVYALCGVAAELVRRRLRGPSQTFG